MPYWNKEGLLESMGDLGPLNEELVAALRDFKEEEISKTRGLDLDVAAITKIFTENVINGSK